MSTIAQNELLAKVPVTELEAEIEKFVEPVTRRMPEKRRKQGGAVSGAGHQCRAITSDHADGALSGANGDGSVGNE